MSALTDGVEWKLHLPLPGQCVDLPVVFPTMAGAGMSEVQEEGDAVDGGSLAHRRATWRAASGRQN